MKRFILIAFALAAAPFVLGMFPETTEKTSEIVVRGLLSCAKCDLGEAKSCVDAVDVKLRKRTSRVYLANLGNRAECGSPARPVGKQEVRVTGVPFKTANERWIAPTRVEPISRATSRQPVIANSEGQIQY